jgi:hypothetical protein
MKVWAYIHPQLNILCCALLPEAVPQGVQAIEFEVESPDDVVYDGKQIKLKTEEEKLQEEKQRKLIELKNYIASLLAPTDYIITKISEAQILGQDISTLEQKYIVQLQKRQKIRAWNEKMKQAINNAQTSDELRSIIIKFED